MSYDWMCLSYVGGQPNQNKDSAASARYPATHAHVPQQILSYGQQILGEVKLFKSLRLALTLKNVHLK